MMKPIISVGLLVGIMLLPVVGWGAYGEIQPDGVSITGLYLLNGDATDDSGNSYNGTLCSGSNEPASIQGIFGQAYEFDGDGCIELVASNTLLGGTTFSFSLWVRVDDMSGDRVISIKRAPDLIHRVIEIHTETHFGTDSFLLYWHDGDGSSLERFNASAISLNQWYWIVVTWDNTDFKTYIDGEYMTTETPNSFSGIGSQNAIVGGFNTGGDYGSECDIDMLVTYDDTVLTAAEIRQLYNLQKGSYGIHTQ